MTDRPAPFGSVLTANITPFGDAGQVDHGQLAALAHYLVENGSDGLIVTGTTGESPTLSDAEKLATYATVLDAVGNKAHVIAGTGTYDTAHSVVMSRRAADLGVHGLMAVTPYYSKPPQEGLYRHFTAIADATDLPLVVYNIPGRTSRLIDADTLARLSEHPNIVATKDSVEDLSFTRKCMDVCDENFAFYTGADAYTLGMVEIGGAGVVSVQSHLVGNQLQAMIAAEKRGDHAEAVRLHELMLPLVDALFAEPNPIPLKGALNEVWDRVGDPRLPLIPASDEVVADVVKALREVQAAA